FSVMDRIFFRDKQGDVKGPFTERKVQEWYRKGWYDDTFPFFFLNANESPSASTKSFSLESLRAHNGIGCPFKMIEKEGRSGVIEGEKRLKIIDEKITVLRQNCDEVEKLEKRIEAVECKTKSLGVHSSSMCDRKGQGDIEQVAEIDEKKTVEGGKNEKPVKPPNISEAEWSDYHKIANQVADFLMNVLRLMETGELEKWDIPAQRSLDRNVISWNSSCKGEKKRLRNDVVLFVLRDRIEKKDFYYCTLCNTIAYTYKHVLMHLTICHQDMEILRSIGFVISSLINEPSLWVAEDEKQRKEDLKKYGNLHALSKSDDLRPKVSYLTGAPVTILAKFPEHNLLRAKHGGSIPVTASVPLMMDHFKRGLGCKMMTELDDHIGKSQTACFFCEVLTGTCDEYYKHLVSFHHLQTVGRLMLPFELFTNLLNFMRKDPI
ncbi:hypothetical protein PFISCL1PPCAC_2290, partial [Pristionchus fissidentatus]